MAEVLEIEIKAKGTDEATSSINDLTNAVKALEKVTNQTAIVKITRQMTALNASLSTVTDETVNRMSKLADALSKISQSGGLSGVSGAIRGATSKATKATKATTTTPTTPDYDRADFYISSSSQIDILRDKYDGARESLAQMIASGKANKEQIANQTAKCQKLSAELTKLANATKDVTETTKGASAATPKLTSGFSKLVKSIGRIAVYRAIRSAIKAVTQAFQEGLTNAYRYSKLVGGDLATTMDTLSTKSLTLKNQLGSAFGSLLQAVAPVLLTIIRLATQAANALAMIFAAFTGGTYLKAKDTLSEWADTTASGAASASEWKNQLMGFDEINKLDDQSSSGGGGGGSGLDYEDMFEEAEISQKIKDIVSWIQEHIDLIKAAIIEIGVLIAAIKLTKLLSQLSQMTGGLKTSLGIILSLVGAGLLVQGVFDAWTNGVDWSNFLTMLSGATVLSLGLGTAFGKVGAAIGMIVSGIALCVVGFKDWLSTGEMTIENFSAIASGILLVGGAISLLIGNWIPLLVAAVTAGVVGIAGLISNNWDSICESTKNVIDKIKSWVTEHFNWLKSYINFIPNLFKNIANGILSTIQSLVDGIVSLVQRAVSAIQNLLSFSSSVSVSSSSSKAKKYASGGTPATGSMFIAGENGAELVSSVSGRTTVSNTDQIANSVSVGNEGVVSAVYAMANAIVKSIDGKDTNVTLDGISVARNLYKYSNQVSREHGKPLINYNYT